MKVIKCDQCGSLEFFEVSGYRICKYCHARYAIISENSKSKTVIDLEGDIQGLLRKCIEDPKNARRYANRVLDLDPDNIEALKYL